MDIKKRNGRTVVFNPQKLIQRCIRYSTEVDIRKYIDKAVIDCQSFFYDGITTEEIDNRLAKCASEYAIYEPEMAFLGGFIKVTSIVKSVKALEYNYVDNPVLKEYFIEKYTKLPMPVVEEPKMSYFAAFTMEEEFLLKNENGDIVETPSSFYWRIALATSNSDKQALEFFKELLERRAATSNPIAVNSGTSKGKLISCTTMSIVGDNHAGITEAMTSSATHSALGSGLGIYIGDTRSKKSLRSRGGTASGTRRLVKMLTPLSQYFRQHEKRRGSFAFYTDMWHLDILDFIPMKRQDLSVSLTDQDGFYGVCIPDLFYKRFEKKEDWSIFCPNEVRKQYGYNLSDFHGEEFEKRYLQIEEDNLIYMETINTSEIMMQLVDSTTSSGVPYVFNRDRANDGYQQGYLGTLKSQQLCNEFSGFHNEEYEAQCDLASIPLPNHIKNGKFDFKSLRKSVRTLTDLLNNVIDLNEWNTPKAEKAGLEHRNIGIGIVGLADTFAILGYTYGDENSRELNREIQKTIYLSALERSNELAIKTGNGNTATLVCREPAEWIPKDLQESLAEHGTMNDLLCCNMPTSTTSKLLDINQSFEVFDFPVSFRETVLGEFKQVNRYLVGDLKELGLWNDTLAEQLLSTNNVLNLDVPQEIKDKYIDKYHHSNKVYLEMAADRQKFIDQGQSMNLYYDKPERSKVSTALYYGWKLGLQSGSYYTTVLKDMESKKGLTSKTTGLTQKPTNSPFECFGCD